MVILVRDFGLWIIKIFFFGVGLLVGVYFLGYIVGGFFFFEMVDEFLRLGRSEYFVKNFFLLFV